MNKIIIIIILLFFVHVASANLSVPYTITTYADSDSQKHNHNSQNSYQIGWNDIEQQEEQEYFSPVDNVTENKTLPGIPEVEPYKIKSDYHWLWIIFGLFLIGLFWICHDRRDS